MASQWKCWKSDIRCSVFSNLSWTKRILCVCYFYIYISYILNLASCCVVLRPQSIVVSLVTSFKTCCLTLWSIIQLLTWLNQAWRIRKTKRCLIVKLMTCKIFLSQRKKTSEQNQIEFNWQIKNNPNLYFVSLLSYLIRQG